MVSRNFVMYTSNSWKGSYLGILLVAGFCVFSAATTPGSTPCALRQTEYGGVCVCNSTYCDYLDDPTPLSNYGFSVVSSSKAGLRFDTLQGTFNLYSKFYIFDYDQRLRSREAAAADMERAVNYVRLEVNREKEYQKIVGFGGAYTGSVAYVMLRLPQDLQDQVHKSFYSRRGIGFNLMRTPIGGCDFDLEPWAYNEKPENDPELSNFQQLDPRDGLKVAQITRLKQVAQANDLKIIASAWSSPIWMKTNGEWTGNSSLKREYYQTWADYHLRYLELMDNAGLPLWALTTGNEPLNGVSMEDVTFMSLGWTPFDQAIWVADNLGPTLRNSKYKDVVIFGGDDQRYTFPQWFYEMQNIRPESMDYMKGLGVHWYFDTEVDPGLLDQTATAYPDHVILNTESCISFTVSENGIYTPALGSWERGEQYVRGFLEDLKHSIGGWIDWNLILDEQGGPNYVNNFVDSPVVANTTSTSLGDIQAAIFYAMGHFSKFIPEGSVRVDVEQSSEDVVSIAFKRPDGTICVIIFNSGTSNAEIGLVDSVRGSFVVNIPPRSLHSVIYR